MAAKDKKQEFFFRSILPEIDIPSHLPLHLYCFQNKSRIKSRTCLIDESTGNTFTYADVELNAKKVAAGLLNLGGIGQGDVIMLLLSNLPEFAFALLGISYLGAISTTVNPCFSADEIFKQVESSRPKLIITEACYVEKVRKFAGIRVICTDSSPAGCLNFSDLKGDEIPATKIKSDDVAVIPYTSGTTGFPKGVMLTHKGLITNIAQQVDGENPNINITTNDVLICVLPMYHMYSMNCVLLCGIRAGATIVIMKKFEINKMLEVIQKYRVTIAHLVPPIVLSIDKSPVVGDYDLSSIRILMSGAAPLGKELERAVRAKLPNAKLGQGHGMTEGGPVISLSLSFAKEPVEMKSGSSGVVLRNAEMKIVDPNTGISLPPNQPGEVCVRGDNVMKGYLYDPEVPTTKMDNGWLQTGDFGYVDDDQELFIIERFKELIKYKEFQVAPAELEAILISHPNISDVAVVPLQDEAVGEVPVAFVVRATGSIITEDQVKQFVSEKVEVYKRINRVIFIDSIPKVASGKILRKELSGRLK